VHLIAEVQPTLRPETWFETFFGLAKGGKATFRHPRRLT
jgi:hypothetical protein